MIINNTNCEIGNKAMASVLLLYYHLVNEGGITNDQTVYLDPTNFNAYDFLGVAIADESLDLDGDLISEGAIIYLLCDLNDMIDEEDFHTQSQTKEIIAALEGHQHSPVPEVALLLKQVSVSEAEFNYGEWSRLLQDIYKKYVHGFFAKKLMQ